MGCGVSRVESKGKASSQISATVNGRSKIVLDRCADRENDDDDQVRILPDPDKIAEVQKLMDRTWRKIPTRDRKRVAGGGRMPKGVRVLNVLRVDNQECFQKYASYASELKERRKGNCEQFAVCTDGFLGDLDQSCSETYLFHGTNPVAAESIARSDFSLAHAGKAAGKMFGPGIYLAEHASKSDEYAKEGVGKFVKQCAMLICRAVAGRVLTVKEKGDQSHRVLSGEFDSVCGDRLAAVGTFREMIFYDEAAVYCQFIVLYSRLYEDEDPFSETAEETLDSLADKEFALSLVVGDPAAIRRIDPSLREDKDFLLAAISINRNVMDYVNDSLKKDRDFVLQAVMKRSVTITVVDGSLKQDREFLLQALRCTSSVLKHIDTSLQQDKDFLFDAIARNALVFKHVDRSFLDDKEFILQALKRNSKAFHHINEALKKDQTFIFEAVSKNARVYTQVGTSLQDDREFTLQALKKNSHVFTHLDGSWKTDQEFMLQALKKNSHVLDHISDTFKTDTEFLVLAISKNAAVFDKLDKSRADDRGFILQAVKRNAIAFKYIDASLKTEDFVLDLVAHDSRVIEYVDLQMKEDQHFCAKARERNPAVSHYLLAHDLPVKRKLE